MIHTGEFSEFQEEIEEILTYVSFETRFLMVTATLPQEVYQQLVRKFNHLALVLGTGLHRLAPSNL